MLVMLYLICFILFVVMFYSNKMNSSSRCCMFMFIPPQISGVTAYSHHHITSHHKNYSAKSYRLKIDRLCITMSFGHLYWRGWTKSRSPRDAMAPEYL